MANKVAVIGICSVFLVALVVAVVVGVIHIKGKNDKSDGSSENISSSKKAVQAVCQPTDYKETCEKSLSSSNSTDAKELIRTGFQAAATEIKNVLANSATVQELNKDESTKAALRVCSEVLDYAIDDLERSFTQLGEYDMSKLNDFIMNLKVWLSGSITSQQTCLDAFEETSGEAAEKMKTIMKTSQELTGNAIAMIAGISSIVKDLNIPNVGNIDTTGFQRKLLSEKNNDFPEWVSFSDRKLLQAKPADIKPNVVVAKDGSGKYNSINKALSEVPKNNPTRFVIHIKAGVYKEQVNVTKAMTNVMFIGDGPTKTIITGDLSVIRNKPLKTFDTATVGVSGFYFIAKDIGFENTAGSEGHQAVALRATSDFTAFYNCHFNGYQDTLYAHQHRQFYRDCSVSGTVDFIFGDARSLFQNCKIIVRKPLANQHCIITAHGKQDKHTETAIVLQNCTISGAPDYIPVKDKNKSYLGRPWKLYARTIVMQSQIDDIITPEGYTPMNGTTGLDTSFYAEFNNRGPGSNTAGRVKWGGVKKIDLNQAKQFTPRVFFKSEEWVPKTGVPCIPDMIPGL